MASSASYYYLSSSTSVCKLLAIIVLISTCSVVIVQSHVALTYPPARKYDLDFLDNSRTKGPCGMPKGEFFKCEHKTFYFSSKFTYII